MKHQALHWVFEGHPVGDYYEAALPGREAFCMRDVSHQCTGAEILGLSSHNKNMFSKFAASISDTRDWCGFWEINRLDRPCSADYRDDTDFWYNLPANFDVLHACWRMYLWTGDKDYLVRPEFDHFYAQTMEAYIKRWDRDGDGLPDRNPGNGRRGIAGYDEDDPSKEKILVATDMLAAMARAHLSCAKICAALGRLEQAKTYRDKGDELLALLNNDFYTEEQGFADGLGRQRELLYRHGRHSTEYLTLYWDTVPDSTRREKMLDALPGTVAQADIEVFSHYPEIQWRYGRREQALLSLRRLMDPGLPRKEYPEASYSAVGAVATGLVGIKPDAAHGIIETCSGLSGIDWAELGYVPVMGREISICHEKLSKTSFTLESGDSVTWRGVFQGIGQVHINGSPVETYAVQREFDPDGEICSYCDVVVNAGEMAEAIFQKH